MNFNNKVAISTGAASGMGLLFSEVFAEEGGNVLLCDVNEAALAEQARLKEQAAKEQESKAKSIKNKLDNSKVNHNKSKP